MGRITMEKLTDSKTVPAIHSELHALLSKHTPTSTAILGLGGIGCKVIALALESIPSPKCTMLAVNTDSRQLDKLSAKHSLLLSSEGDERLMPAIDTHDLIIVISGAGGLGEVITYKLCKDNGHSGKLIIPILFKPFEFEGIKRNDAYQHLLQELLKLNIQVLVLDNQKVLQQMNPDKAFTTLEQELMRQVVRLIIKINEKE